MVPVYSTDSYRNGDSEQVVESYFCFSYSYRYLVISEKLEEIKSFRDLTCLDLSCCKLGDDHELLEHITKETLSRYKFAKGKKIIILLVCLLSAKKNWESSKVLF